MKHLKSYKKFELILESSKTMTVEEVIEIYKKNPAKWSMAENQFYDMAEGGDGDYLSDDETVRSKYYAGWTDEDFQTVIDAMS
jgi:hypothetical protein